MLVYIWVRELAYIDLPPLQEFGFQDVSTYYREGEGTAVRSPMFMFVLIDELKLGGTYPGSLYFPLRVTSGIGSSMKAGVCRRS